MTRSERVFRVLLRAYPKHIRDASGDDMAQLLNDRLRDAGTPRDAVAVWADVLVDLVRTAPRERLRRRQLWQLVEGPAEDAPRVPMKRDVAFALLPVWLSLALTAWHPGYYDILFVSSPGFLGMPLGAAILLLFGFLAGGGLLAARRTRELNDPWHQALILAVTLVPAPALAVVAGPATASIYAMGVTLLVLVARFKRLMLALVVPFLAWLVVGPLVMGVVVPVMQGVGEAL